MRPWHFPNKPSNGFPAYNGFELRDKKKKKKRKKKKLTVAHEVLAVIIWHLPVSLTSSIAVSLHFILLH